MAALKHFPQSLRMRKKYGFILFTDLIVKLSSPQGGLSLTVRQNERKLSLISLSSHQTQTAGKERKSSPNHAP